MTRARTSAPIHPVPACHRVIRPTVATGAVVAVLMAHGPGWAQTDSVTESTPTYDARVFHETVSFSGTSFSADERRILLTSDETGVFNVYSQPVDGGERTPLTASTTESIRGVSWFPDDDRFLYVADQGGNELTHVYVQDPDGSVRDLTPGDNLLASFAGWSGDQTGFYVRTNERDPRAFDIYRYDTDSYERELVWENDGSYLPGGVSRDGRWLGLTRATSNVDSDVFPRRPRPRNGHPRHAPRGVRGAPDGGVHSGQPATALLDQRQRRVHGGLVL